MQKKGLRGRRKKNGAEKGKDGKKRGETADCVLRRCLEQFRWEKRGWEQRELQYCVK